MMNDEVEAVLIIQLEEIRLFLEDQSTTDFEREAALTQLAELKEFWERVKNQSEQMKAIENYEDNELAERTYSLLNRNAALPRNENKERTINYNDYLLAEIQTNLKNDSIETSSIEEQLKAVPLEDIKAKTAADENLLKSGLVVGRCDGCYEEKPKELHKLNCEHKHCTECITRIFKTASKDKSLLPVKCCKIPLDQNIAEAFLNPAEWKQYKSLLDEVMIKNKMFW